MLRPRGIPEIADLALVLIRLHFGSFLALSPWVLVPAVLAWSAVAFGGVGEDLVSFVYSGVLMVTSGVFTVLCGDLAIYECVDVRDVHRRFLRELPRLIGAALLALVLLTLTLYLGFGRVVFQTEAMVLERQGLVPALGRSAALARATPGRSLVLFLLFVALAVWGSLAGELIDRSVRELVGLGAGEEGLFGGGHLSWYVGLALVMPVWATVRFLAYLDCRTRREGWDLQMRVASHVAASEARTALGRQVAA